MSSRLFFFLPGLDTSLVIDRVIVLSLRPATVVVVTAI